MRSVIVGASGGIGGALTRQLVQAGHEVHALSRTGRTTIEGAIGGIIDTDDEASIEAAAAVVKAHGAPDWVIVASGLLSDETGLTPEKTYRNQSADAFAKVFAVNTVGPALVAKHFLPVMPRNGEAIFAALSARIGSISDNRLGGWHAYRASKAALNMLIRNFAIEQGRRNPDFIALGLHPGTVDTALSKPFQSNVSAEQLFTAEQSAAHLIRVLGERTPADSGKVFDWAGNEIPA